MSGSVDGEAERVRGRLGGGAGVSGKVVVAVFAVRLGVVSCVGGGAGVSGKVAVAVVAVCLVVVGAGVVSCVGMEGAGLSLGGLSGSSAWSCRGPTRQTMCRSKKACILLVSVWSNFRCVSLRRQLSKQRPRKW